MTNGFTISIPINNSEQAARVLAALEVAFRTDKEDETEETSAIHASDLKKKKPGRPAKAKTEEVDEDEELELGEDDEEEESEDTESSDEEEESEDEAEEEDEESETLGEKDLAKLKGSLKAYSAKHGKEKAVKLLNKYAKSSQDVKTSDLPKLLKSLKV